MELHEVPVIASMALTNLNFTAPYQRPTTGGYADKQMQFMTRSITTWSKP